MYRERHGCNSMPPLYCLSTTKLIRYCNKNKFFTQIINFHGWGDVGRCVWRGEGRTFGTQLWEAPRQPLHNCVSAGLARHLVAFSRCVRYRIDMSRCITLCGLQPMQRSVRHSETMTGGVHFSNPGGGWRRAKPRISPRVGEATCGACQIAPVHNRTPEVVRGCAPAVVRCVSSCVPHGCVVQ